MGAVAAAWAAATVYLFKHASDVNFATWGTISATMVGVYHWICIRDSKQEDLS